MTGRQGSLLTRNIIYFGGSVAGTRALSFLSRCEQTRVHLRYWLGLNANLGSWNRMRERRLSLGPRRAELHV